MIENHRQNEKIASKDGTNAPLVVQKRDMEIMQSLSLLRILDREQISIIAGFQSTTRANARLLKLLQADLLKRFFFVSPRGGKRSVYCLSNKGAQFAGIPANAISRPSNSFLLGDKFVAHQLTINDVYCQARIGKDLGKALQIRWRPCAKPFTTVPWVIPDVYFEIRSSDFIRPLFLEVDLGTESLRVWSKKIEGYLAFATSGEFETVFQHPRFGVAIVTNSENRLLSLRSHIAKSTSKLFYLTTLERIKGQGFWSKIWLRPDHDQVQSLI